MYKLSLHWNTRTNTCKMHLWCYFVFCSWICFKGLLTKLDLSYGETVNTSLGFFWPSSAVGSLACYIYHGQDIRLLSSVSVSGPVIFTQLANVLPWRGRHYSTCQLTKQIESDLSEMYLQKLKKNHIVSQIIQFKMGIHEHRTYQIPNQVPMTE